MECIRNMLVSFYVCKRLFSIDENSFGTRRMTVFATYLEDIHMLKESFSYSEIIHVPRTQNTMADSLARSAQKQPLFVVYMDSELPVWFAEFSLSLFVDDKKKHYPYFVNNMNSKFYANYLSI